MQEKICGHCDKSKPITEFSPNKRSKDRLQYFCKECSRKKASDWYTNNKLRGIDKANKRNKFVRDCVNRIKGEYGCICCGENEQCCLDFHHVDANSKIKSVSSLAYGKSNSKLLEEIEKCVPD